MAGGRRGARGGRRGKSSVGEVLGKDKEYEEDISDAEVDNGGRNSQKVSKKLDEAMYRENSLSEGGKMKQLVKVIERCKKELKRPENVNCRVEYFGMIVNEFCEKKRKIIKEMGFAGLFGLVDKQLPRELCYWLATRVDVASYSLNIPDGLEFTFDPIQVHWVLGIPKGHLPVLKEAVDDTARHYLDRVIMYLDRLRRPLLKWGVFSRLKAWTEADINKAKKVDCIVDGDFGKLGCVNAAYGRPHERDALDLMPMKRSAVAAKVAEVLMRSVDQEDSEEDIEEELILTQDVKKHPREGPDYFGRNKSSGSGNAKGI